MKNILYFNQLFEAANIEQIESKINEFKKELDSYKYKDIFNKVFEIKFKRTGRIEIKGEYLPGGCNIFQYEGEWAYAYSSVYMQVYDNKIYVFKGALQEIFTHLLISNIKKGAPKFNISRNDIALYIDNNFDDILNLMKDNGSAKETLLYIRDDLNKDIIKDFSKIETSYMKALKNLKIISYTIGDRNLDIYVIGFGTRSIDFNIGKSKKLFLERSLESPMEIIKMLLYPDYMYKYIDDDKEIEGNYNPPIYSGNTTFQNTGCGNIEFIPKGKGRRVKKTKDIYSQDNTFSLKVDLGYSTIEEVEKAIDDTIRKYLSSPNTNISVDDSIKNPANEIYNEFVKNPDKYIDVTAGNEKDAIENTIINLFKADPAKYGIILKDFLKDPMIKKAMDKADIKGKGLESAIELIGDLTDLGF